MTLDAISVESFERCRRQWAFTQEYEMIRVTPMGTLYKALHLTLTSPFPLWESQAAMIAKDSVMHEAGERGVWTNASDPYRQMKHYSALAEVLARILRQPSAEPLEIHPLVKIGDHQWQPQSYLIDGGMRLMRIVICDHWDDDRQLAELHSWRTVGDVSSTGLPMTLRILVIGQSQEGRRHSFWTKGQQHPRNKQLRFTRKHAKSEGFAGSWQTVWREESGISAQVWLEQMARDGVLKELAFNRQVKVPSKEQREKALTDIARIGHEMELVRFEKAAHCLEPMTRSACDDPIRGQCPFQCVCFSPIEISPADTGVFRSKK